MPYSNRWNRFVYACWSPFYDWLIGLAPFRRARTELWRIADVQPRQTVLLVGVGTGQDIPYIPANVTTIGFDLSRPMLARAQRRLRDSAESVHLLQADALHMPLPDAAFDVVVLALILSVVPDPRRCLNEAARVVTDRGTIVILDKFAGAAARPSMTRRLVNLITKPFGTDVTRRLDLICSGLPVTVVQDRPAAFRAAYRVAVLKKTSA